MNAKAASAGLVLCLSCAPQIAGFAPHWSPPCRVGSSVKPQLQSHLMAAQNEGPFAVLTKSLGGLFGGDDKEVGDESPPLPDVVISPDFKLAAIFLVLGIALDSIPYVQLTLGPLVTALGVLFLVQTFRVRFVFDREGFSVQSGSVGEDSTSVGENVLVGGENKWAYESFVNYDFFPDGWIDQPQGPILVYFKETQTPSDKWDQGPGAKANSADSIAAGAQRGQVHFFPALGDAKQMREEFEKRGCAKL